MGNMIMDTIRQAIQDCGKTRYRIYMDTGIEQSVLCKIMGGGTCSMDTADKLCEYLGLKLKPCDKRAR
jgi:hypothetical protein